MTILEKEKIVGKLRLADKRRGYRLIYKCRKNVACAKCHSVIISGHRYSKSIGKHNAICTACQPITGKMLPYEAKKDPLAKFVANSNWFFNANGDARRTCRSIIKAAGYERTVGALTTNTVRMVAFRLQNINLKLADRFVYLANEFLEQKVGWYYNPASLKNDKLRKKDGNEHKA